MQISNLINNLFRQNFSDPEVFGRVLFGIAVFLLGVANLIDLDTYTNYAPDHLPFPSILALLVGLSFVVSGLLIAANIYIRKATAVLGIIFALFILVVYLPTPQYLDAMKALALLGATIFIGATSKHHEEPLEEKKDS